MYGGTVIHMEATLPFVVIAAAVYGGPADIFGGSDGGDEGDPKGRELHHAATGPAGAKPNPQTRTPQSAKPTNPQLPPRFTPGARMLESDRACLRCEINHEKLRVPHVFALYCVLSLRMYAVQSHFAVFLRPRLQCGARF